MVREKVRGRTGAHSRRRVGSSVRHPRRGAPGTRSFTCGSGCGAAHLGLLRGAAFRERIYALPGVTWVATARHPPDNVRRNQTDRGSGTRFRASFLVSASALLAVRRDRRDRLGKAACIADARSPSVRPSRAALPAPERALRVAIESCGVGARWHARPAYGMSASGVRAASVERGTPNPVFDRFRYRVRRGRGTRICVLASRASSPSRARPRGCGGGR